VTTYNNLSTLTFDSLCLLTGHYLDKSFSFITVTATANVPPQGDTSCNSNMTKCKWGKSLFLERGFINPLAFVLQMVRMCNPIYSVSSHLQEEPNGGQCLYRMTLDQLPNTY
jgi:hypothetical protein